MATPPQKVRVGVVGLGIGRTHLDGYQQLSDSVEIVGVCDLNEDRVKEVAAEYDVSRKFTDYNELFARNDIDAVSLCVPNNLHAELAVAAVAAGKHVLTEKPMADTLANAQKIVEAARTTDKVFMLGMNNRFREDTQVLKAMINQGDLGEIYFAKCGWTRRNGIPGLGGWFTTKALSGGGPLLDIGVHALDVTTYLMGNPIPVSVSGAVYAKFGPRGRGGSAYGYAPDPSTLKPYTVEDLATALVKFDNGATLFLEASWASYIAKDHFYTSLHGTEGGADLDPFVIYKDMGNAPVDIAPQVTTTGMGHAAEIKHFIECIQQGKPAISTAEQGLHILQILDAVYRSAESGRETIISQ